MTTTQQDNITDRAKNVLPSEQSEEVWTTAHLIDKFSQDLSRAHDYVRDSAYGHTLIIAKYYEQAERLMYRIAVYRPPPCFEIELKDLSLKVKADLAMLKKMNVRDFDYVKKMAVGHIFENINFKYFHGSVMRYLRVKFIP